LFHSAVEDRDRPGVIAVVAARLELVWPKVPPLDDEDES
jgi:hypothetical protein